MWPPIPLSIQICTCRLRGSFGARLTATMGSSTGRVASTPTLYEERWADQADGFGVPNSSLSAMPNIATNSRKLTFNRRPRNDI